MTDYSIKRFHKYTNNELIERLQTYAKNLEVSFVSAEGFSKATGISKEGLINSKFQVSIIQTPSVLNTDRMK